MAVSGEGFDRAVSPELLAVADAAGARLRADVARDRDLVAATSQDLLAAATAAISANYSLMEIAQAEARGKEKLRQQLGGDALKRVERTARQASQAETEHHRAIGGAMRLGLSMREIALAAGVTHGTIRAISNRLAEDGDSSDVAGDQMHAAEEESAARPTDLAEVSPTATEPPNQT